MNRTTLGEGVAAFDQADHRIPDHAIAKRANLKRGQHRQTSRASGGSALSANDRDQQGAWVSAIREAGRSRFPIEGVS
ncbi:MAG: hypothetical protein OXB95_01050 [Rhodobacteraceae bacterium]|nr:hypothetical protein [Paracoccaceae bacterium]